MRKLMVCAFTVVALASMSGVASATAVKAKSNIQRFNADCGNSTGEAKIGTAVLKRVNNEVSVTYKLTNGIANDHYEVTLWNATGGACEDLGAVASFTTSAKGKGSAKGEITVPETDVKFFATGLDSIDGEFNDALTVNLP
jgi:hypothetical protein